MTGAHPGRSLPARTTVDDVLDVAGAAEMGALASVPAIGPTLREVVGTVWTELRYERADLPIAARRRVAQLTPNLRFLSLGYSIVGWPMRSPARERISEWLTRLREQATADTAGGTP